MINESYISSTEPALRREYPEPTHTVTVLLSDSKVDAEKVVDMARFAAYALAALRLAYVCRDPVSAGMPMRGFDGRPSTGYAGEITTVSLPCVIPAENDCYVDHAVKVFVDAVYHFGTTGVNHMVEGVYVKNDAMDPGDDWKRMKGGVSLSSIMLEDDDEYRQMPFVWRGVRDGDMAAANREFAGTLTDKDKTDFIRKMIVLDDEDHKIDGVETDVWRRRLDVSSGCTRWLSSCFMGTANLSSRKFTYTEQNPLYKMPDGSTEVIIVKKTDPLFSQTKPAELRMHAVADMNCTDTGIFFYVADVLTVDATKYANKYVYVDELMTVSGMSREYCRQFLMEILAEYYGKQFADWRIDHK